MRSSVRFVLVPLCLLAASGGCGDDGDGGSGATSQDPSARGGAAPEPGSLHARFVGDWEGELAGRAGKRLERVELAVQKDAPSAAQLADLSDEERSKLEKKRKKIAASSDEQTKMTKNMLQQMKSIFEDVELQVGPDQLVFRMGRGRSDRKADYEVLEQKGNELRIRSQGKGGAPQKRTLVFDGHDTFRMQMDVPRGKVTLRFTRK